jgi:hypothetical protein
VRARGLLVVLALLLTATPLSPAGAGAAAPPLTRDVTVTGTGTGWVPVRLTRPLTFARLGQPQVLRVSDPAAFTGLLFVRQQAGPWPPGAGVVSLPEEGGLRYATTFFGHERGTNDPDDNPMVFRRTLAAGTYRLYLLARSRVTVTVRFPLASGSRRVTIPRNAAHHDVTSLAPGVPGVSVASAHSHSGTAELRRRGLVLSLTWWQGDISALHEGGSCAYAGPDPDPGPAVPSCPNGPGAMAGGQEIEQPAGRMAIGYSYVAPARWLQKAYFAVAGPLRRAGIALYWLDLGAGFPAH